MLALYTLLAIIAIVVIYEIVANDDEDNLLDIEMSNTEYEKRFIYAVSRIDRGNINWTIEALREIKGDSKYYCSNPKAIAILNKFEGVYGNGKIKFIIKHGDYCLYISKGIW